MGALGVITGNEDDLKKLSLELGRARDLVFVKAIQGEALGLLFHELDCLETEFLERSVFSSRFQLEIKRRIAEHKFMLVKMRNCPYDEVVHLYGKVCELGFTNLERDATMRIFFAQYCVKNLRSADAKGILIDLRSRLAKAYADDGQEVWSDLINSVDENMPVEDNGK